MKLLNLEYIKTNEDFIISEMKNGKIFIYPTDTVFGIGCDATNSNSVKKILEIKKRNKNSLLVLSPGLNWINENCTFNKNHEKELKDKLPGPFSFIVKSKPNINISKDVFPNNKTTLGVRIPNCYFSKIVEKAKIPFITTSVNISGEPPATSINDIPENILNQVDYVLEQDEQLLGRPSTILDITKDEIIKIR